VPHSGKRHGGAFGSFTGSKTETVDRLKRLRAKCAEAHHVRLSPTIRSNKSNTDRLRHLYAEILQMDVIFQPQKGWLPVKGPSGSCHGLTCKFRSGNCSCKGVRSIAFLWKDNPVWGHAPPGALRKSHRISNLLHLIVENGHLIDLSHDLMRLAITLWQSSLRNFLRLCRRISARIAEAVRSTANVLKSPEPNAASGGLTFNPVLHCAIRRHAGRPKKVKYVPRYIPPYRRERGFPYAGDSVKLLQEQWAKPIGIV